jgi:chromate transporter
MFITGFQLFITFFKIGLLAIGGAYSFLPLFEEELVENRAWITMEEFGDIIAITEFFPGAKSVKFATYAGYKLLGVPGVIIANLANFLPPALIVVFASQVFAMYKEHPRLQNALAMIKIALVSMIITVALNMGDWKTIMQPKKAVVLIASFLLTFIVDIHPAIVIAAAGLFGFIFM